jgi:exodeoxyribonuclease X
MRIVVLDTETTGMKDEDQVLELALVSWQHPSDSELSDQWSSLIKPTCPVSTGARAVHHVSDAMLAEQWTMEELLQRRGLPELGIGPGDLGDEAEDDEYLNDRVCVAAHNLKFDWGKLIASGVAEHRMPAMRICTWRCAMHLYPDSEDGHSNQVLRYHLNLVVPQVTDLPPHRALPDAVVTAALLRHMLESKTPDELVKLTTTPVNLKRVRFGKHFGMLWKDVPSDYLDYILKRDFDTDVMHTARTVLESRSRPLLRR